MGDGNIVQNASRASREEHLITSSANVESFRYSRPIESTEKLPVDEQILHESSRKAMTMDEEKNKSAQAIRMRTVSYLYLNRLLSILHN